MESISRRAFLKNGTIAGTILTISGASNNSAQQQAAQPAKIRYRSLGSTGWKVSEIGFGCMNTRDPELIKAAVDAGINYFDTSMEYMNGQNEEILGSALSGSRDKVFLTTKLSPADSTDQLRASMEASLKRLKTDHVDGILIHGGGVEQLKSQMYIDTFGEFFKKGLARAAGVSAHSNIPAILDAMTASKFWNLASVSYNFTSTPEVTEAIARARAAGVGIVAMKTMNKGRGHAALASETMTANQGAIKFVLQNRNVDTTIPGMTSFEHIAEDMKVMELELTLNNRNELLRYSESLKGKYCSGISGCTGCQNQCPYGVQIHEINRCLGYVHGYKDMPLARANYVRLPSHSRVDACSGCDTCKVKCVNGLNLDENIRKARMLFC